jgi:UDP-N-acetylglucosamine:LPS N-acetylglucosamine transferase
MKLVAIASGGGHWVQLRRLQPVLDEHDVRYVSVEPSYADEVGADRLYLVRDASRWSKLGLVVQAFQVLWVLVRLRPDAVVSTGASPGFFGLLFGKLLGARTIWLDSLANVDEMSLSGRLAKRYADLWLTQWPHLASSGGPQYVGAVL